MKFEHLYCVKKKSEKKGNWYYKKKKKNKYKQSIFRRFGIIYFLNNTGIIFTWPYVI